MNIHRLDGCAPAPLAHYLKALGILRLVAEQADPEARGWWSGDRFLLATGLKRDELERFFLECYMPTPIFNPWGGRSGFYPENSEKKARNVLKVIEQSSDPRFFYYKVIIRAVRSVIDSRFGGQKPKDDERQTLVRILRNAIRGKAPLWIDSVTALVGCGDRAEIEQPALFGTGGNEGSGSYTSAYMEAIDQCLLKRLWDHALSSVLFAENENPNCGWRRSMGQFIPEGDGSPWELLLAFEGGCVIRSAVTSRNTTESARWMSSPFYMAPASYGYPSGSQTDEFFLNKGNPYPGRGEQWFPLWKNPMGFEEINQLFQEGRATSKKGRATDGYGMVRAVKTLGVRQGISEFVRFGYQQRNNMATHFAVPLGRFQVPERVSPRLSCLDDLDRWLTGLRRAARDKHAPARLQMVERRLSDALFAVAVHPDEPARWQAVLLAMADVESVLRTGTGHNAGPIPPLRPEWVFAANDGTPGFRLAVAFALQSPRDSLRRHWLPLDKWQRKFATSGTGAERRLESSPAVVMHGRSGADDCIAAVWRRLVEAAQDGNRGGKRTPALFPGRRASARTGDLGRLLAGDVDINRTMGLARAMLAVDWRKWRAAPVSLGSAKRGIVPDDAWIAVRLACLPFPLPPEDRQLPFDPSILRRLEAGDAAAAVNLSLRRLRSAGIRATVRAAAASPDVARLWAAALAFPIHSKTADQLLARIDPNTIKEKTS
jgi:CRISPR-associated protein Csx17